jgi:hypothetical protein
LQAAPGPKRIRIVSGVGHNDLVPRAGESFAQAIADWASELLSPTDQ